MKQKLTFLIIPLYFIIPLSVFAYNFPASYTCQDSVQGYISFNLSYITLAGEGVYGNPLISSGGNVFDSNGNITSNPSGTCPDLISLSTLTGGGIFSRTTTGSLVASIGEVSAPIFTGVFPYLMLTAGVFIAFLIVQKLISIFFYDKKKKK
jgi:hypothetical protein